MDYRKKEKKIFGKLLKEQEMYNWIRTLSNDETLQPKRLLSLAKRLYYQMAPPEWWDHIDKIHAKDREKAREEVEKKKEEYRRSWQEYISK